MMKLLFYIIVLILAALVGLLIDHYLHSSEAWHGDVGVELFQQSEETESREFNLPIFLDGVPWNLDRLQTITMNCFDRLQTIVHGSLASMQHDYLDGVPWDRWHKMFLDGVPWVEMPRQRARESQDPHPPY